MRYTVTYVVELRWQIKDKPQYKWSTCKRLYNTKTGNEIKKTMKSRSIGYWIGKEFISINQLKQMVEIIPKTNLPF